MASPAQLPGHDEIVRLMANEGLTQTGVAVRYGVSRPAVHKALVAAGLDPEEVALRRYRPWQPKAMHLRTALAKRVQDYQRMRAGIRKLEHPFALAEWIDYMDRRQLVVDYDHREGFYLEPRKAGDTSPVRGLP